MPPLRAVIAASASPIFGSKPKSNLHVGVSITPSRVMNSCTAMPPMPLPPYLVFPKTANPAGTHLRPERILPRRAGRGTLGTRLGQTKGGDHVESSPTARVLVVA